MSSGASAGVITVHARSRSSVLVTCATLFAISQSDPGLQIVIVGVCCAMQSAHNCLYRALLKPE